MAVTELGLTNRRARAADFMELTKPRITLMVLITTLVGFYMGSEGDLQRMLLVNTILGTALVAAGPAGSTSTWNAIWMRGWSEPALARYPKAGYFPMRHWSFQPPWRSRASRISRFL
jgi:hypothetical protein